MYQIKTYKMSDNTINKSKESASIIRNHIIWSMGGGAIPIPFIDLIAVTAIQLDMIKQLARVYGVDYKETEGKAIVTALTGSAVASIGKRAIKFIPGIGSVLGGVTMAVMSGASTYAVGQVFIRHFESGGTFLNFDVEASKAYFKEVYAEGKEYVTNQKGKQEGEDVDEKGWLNWFNSRNKKQSAVEEELADLRKSNEELKAMVAELKAALEGKR